MRVVLGSGRHHDAISRKITPDPNQLQLDNMEGAYDFLEVLSSELVTWDKAVLLFAALDDKEEPDIQDIFDILVEQGLRNPKGDIVFVDKQEQFKGVFYSSVAPRLKAHYLSYDKVTIPVLESIICGEVQEKHVPFVKPPECEPTFAPIPPPQPPAPKAPEPPPPPPEPVYQAPPPPPPAPIQQPTFIQEPHPSIDPYADLRNAVAEMKRRSRTFIVTGARRSGVTGTIANMAMAASRLGINTLVVDMDIIRRGQFAYYPQNFSDFDARMTHGLSNVLRSYVMLDQCVWNIQDNLDILGMDFSITDARIQETYADNEKLQYLLTASKIKYDLTLVDMPFEKLKKYPSCIALAERSAYVMSNDVMSLVNFLHEVVPDEFEATVDFQVFESRVGLIINQYNQNNTYCDDVVLDSKIPELLTDISEDPIYEDYEILGSIPYIPKYGLQTDNHPLLTESSEDYLMKFFRILYNMYR